MVEDQGPPSGRAGKDAGKAPFLLPSQPPQRQGVPWSTRGEIRGTAEERGNYSGSRSTGEGRGRAHPAASSGLGESTETEQAAPGRMGDTSVQSF